jgi:putative FmdB family regulatory protein
VAAWCGPYNFTFCIKGLAMPIYAYRCADCGHTKDVLQKLSDPVLSTCPACGKEAFAKQLTAAGFQLKGSGWYATDFKGGSSAPSTSATPAAETPSAPAKTESSSASPAGGACGSACACH